MMRTLTVGVLILALVGCHDDKPHARSASSSAQLAKASNAPEQPAAVNSDKLQLVAGVTGPMPTGIAVSKAGRIFVNFPRWGDPVEFTVAELKDGKLTAYPDREINGFTPASHPGKHLVSVQSVVIDAKDRLWIVDTGSINMGPAKADGQKLICVDLNTNQIIQTIHFKPDVALPTTYLNDIRFDLDRQRGYITDSSDSGPNGIIVVDLATGESWRRLSDHPSTKAQPNFAPIVEGEPLMAREPGKAPVYPKIGSDGIALSGDKKTLYYRPLIGRHLYSASAEVLGDRNKSEQDIAATVNDFGDIGYCSDGLETGKQGQIYLTDYEHNAIHVRTTDGKDRVLVTDPRMIWPDSMSAAGDGFLYFTANQLNRQKKFHDGQDQRQQPFAIFRIPMEASATVETALAR
jgi:sugar lactone lactonase YvrE